MSNSFGTPGAKDATSLVKGSLRLSGDLSGTSASPLVKSRTTYVIAPAGYEGAADVVCNGINDQIFINAALALGLDNYTLLGGDYYTTAKIDLSIAGGGLTLRGSGNGSCRIHGADSDYTIAGTTKDTIGKLTNLYDPISVIGIDFISQRGSCLTITNVRNPYVEDLQLSFSTTPLVRQGLTFIWCTDLKFKNIRFYRTAGNGLSINGCKGFSGDTLTGWGGPDADDMLDIDSDFNDTNTEFSSDGTISNINVDTIGKGTGVRVEHAHNVTLTNLNIRNVTSLNGAGLYINTGGSFNQKNIVVSNVIVNDCPENGIVIEGAESEKIQLSNVLVRNSGIAGGTGVRAGIRIGAPGVTLNGPVVVDGSTKVGGDGAGIMLYGYNAKIVNPTIINCATGIRAWNGDGNQSYASTVIKNPTYDGNSNDEVLTTLTGTSQVDGQYGQTSFANSMNQVVFNSTVAGSSPTISPNGPDSNLGMIFQSKGTGRILYRPGTDALNSFSWQNAAATFTTLNVDTINGRVGVGITTPTSRLFVSGSLGLLRTALNDISTTLNADQVYITFSTQTAARTVTLPSATTNAGRVYVIADELGTAATHNINVATSSSQTIDGASSYTINQNYGTITVISTGSGWKKISL